MLFIVSGITVHAQPKLNVYNVNTENFPEVSAEFLLVDQFGQQINVVDKGEFRVNESGILRSVEVTDCPDQVGKKDISAILVIDVSTSMEGQRIQRAKLAANNLLGLIAESPNSETAIIAFADEAFLVSPFSQNTSQLQEGVDALEALGGTNYQSAFLDPLAGAIKVAETAANEVHVFFLTDGYGKVVPGDIILGAASKNIKVHSIAYNIEIPNVLEEISDNTGGLTFSNLESQEQLDNAFETILEYAFNSSRCTISWQTEGCLTDRDVEIQYLPLGLSDEFTYFTDAKNLAFFFYPLDNFAVFESPSIIQLGVEARNGNIRLDSITSSHPFFKVISPTLNQPLLLEEGEGTQIFIEYEPEHPNLASSIITIHSSSCRFNEIYAIGGDDGTSPSLGGLELIEPKGGEVYLSSADTLIKWKGVLPSDEVRLEFSSNDGLSWQLIEESAMNLEHPYQYPQIVSDECRVRASQISQNFGKKIYGREDSSFQAIDLAWDRSGDKIALAKRKGTLEVLNSVNGSLRYSYDIGDSLYAVDYSFDDIRIGSAGIHNVYMTNTISSITDTVLKLSNKRISDIKFHQNGRLLAIGTRDSTLEIYDIRNWTRIQNIKFNNGAVTEVQWSPDGEKIAVSTNNIKLFVIDTNFYDSTQSVDVTDNTRRNVTAVSWSPDSRFLAASTNARRSKIIDVSSLTVLREYQHHTVSLLNDIAWNPTRNMVVSIAEDSRSVVFNPNIVNENDAIIYDFPESGYFNTVEWSPNGERFAVVKSKQLDGISISVYSVDNFIVQQDVSERFSLVELEASSEDIYVGETPVSLQLDYFEESYIVNEGNLPISIDSLYILDDKGVFDISGNPYPRVISSGDSIPLFISYTPTIAELSTATLRAETSAGNLDITVSGRGIESELQILTNNVDFGELLVGSQKDTIVALAYNRSSLPIDISGSFLLPLPNTPFSNISSPPGTLQAGDTLFAEVSFNPSREGTAQNFLAFENSSPINPARLKLSGIGIRPILNAPTTFEKNAGVCIQTIRDSIEVSNTGTGTLRITDLEYIGDGSVIFDMTSLEVAAGVSRFIKFEFTLAGELTEGSIEISSNSSSGNNPFIVDLQYSSPTPSFSLESTTVFPALRTNSQIEKEVEIKNTGSTSITWDQDLIGNLLNGFELLSISPQTLMPGESSIFTFRFSSSDEEGEFSLDYKLGSDCSDSLLLSFTASVGSDRAVIDHLTNIAFDTLRCGNNQQIEILLRSIGTTELNISDLKSNNNNIEFLEVFTGNIEPGSEETISVRYAGNQKGQIEFEILIISNAENSDGGIYKIPVTYFIADERLGVSPSSLLFDENTLTQVLSIENIGNIEVQPSLVLPTAYQADALNSLQPGERVELEITADPTSPGFQNVSQLILESCELYEVELLYSIGGGLLSIELPQLRSVSGSEHDLQIKINSNRPYPYPLTLELATNRTLLRPLSPIEPAPGGEIENDYLHRVSIDSLMAGDNIINVPYLSAWGNDTISKITASIVDLEQDWRAEYNQGWMIFDDICRVAGGRLYSPQYLNDFVDRINVAVFNKELHFSLPESNPELSVSFAVYDLKGREMLSDKLPASGLISIQTDFVSGTYYVLYGIMESGYAKPYIFTIR